VWDPCLALFLRSIRTVAFANLACISSPSLSDKSASKAHSDRVGTSLAHPSSSSISFDEESLSDVPLCSGYKWVDSGVREYFSKYKWSSSIHRFAETYAILDEDNPDEAMS